MARNEYKLVVNPDQFQALSFQVSLNQMRLVLNMLLVLAKFLFFHQLTYWVGITIDDELIKFI